MTTTTAPAEAPEGVHDSFVDQLRPLLPVAHRLAHAMLRSPDEAEDAVQDAILNAWRAFGRLRPDSAMRPWFLTIVANQCRQRRRNRWWSVIKGGELPELSGGDPADRSDADDLRRALARLPHDQRLAVVLRYYLDLSFDEVGRTLGVSGPAAKSRVHRALTRLRLELPEVPDHA